MIRVRLLIPLSLLKVYIMYASIYTFDSYLIIFLICLNQTSLDINININIGPGYLNIMYQDILELVPSLR